MTQKANCAIPASHVQPHTHTPEQPESAAHRAETAFHAGILHDLLEAGAEVVQLFRQGVALQAAAMAQTKAGAAPPDDLSVRFDRLARTIRRTMLLARSLHNPPAQAERAPASPQPNRAAGPKADAPERLDAPERPDRAEKPGQRPVADIVAAIERDLSLVGRDIGQPLAQSLRAGTAMSAAGVAPWTGGPVRRDRPRGSG